MTDENGQAAPKVDASELASMMVGGGMVGSRSDWGLFTQKHKIGGSAKGSSQYDPFAKEQFLAFEELDLHECVQIHEHHWLAQRYVSRTSRDMTREGIDLEVEGDSDHDVAVAVMQKLNQLDYRTMFQRMVEDELVLGDGMLALGTDESDLDIGEELNEDQVSDVLFLSPFNRLDVSRAEEDKDIWSLNFGGILRYEMAPMIMENSEALERAVHRSRVLHLQTRPQKGSVWGIPMFQYLYPILQNITNTDWTIGHVLRKMVVLVYKSDKLMEQLMKSVDGQTGKVDWSKVGQFHEQLKMETNVLSQ
ncbi:MAG: anti-CBASS protein Acb1 family protein, partial [Salinibacter sp.]